MSCTCRVFIAVSLDGNIARSNGSIDWLTGLAPPTGGEDYGYLAFMKAVDTIIMGRKTYETAMSFSNWPYKGKQTIVLTKTGVTIPTELQKVVRISSDSPKVIVEKLEDSGSAGVYVDGGQTIRSFLQAGLIDEMTITWTPILIGNGIPLFGEMGNDVELNLVRSRSYTNGFVQSTYKVRRPA